MRKCSIDPIFLHQCKLYKQIVLRVCLSWDTLRIDWFVMWQYDFDFKIGVFGARVLRDAQMVTFSLGHELCEMLIW